MQYFLQQSGFLGNPYHLQLLPGIIPKNEVRNDGWARQSPAPVKLSSECDKLAITKDSLSFVEKKPTSGLFLTQQTDHMNSNLASPCTRKSLVPQNYT